MVFLECKSPELPRYFLGGDFTVQVCDTNPFSRLPIVHILEETFNKDSQTGGGTRCFILKTCAVSWYHLTAEHRAQALRRLRDLLAAQKPRFGHPNLKVSRIKRDERNVTSVVEMLENTWGNPFCSDPADLVSISTGIEGFLD